HILKLDLNGEEYSGLQKDVPQKSEVNEKELKDFDFETFHIEMTIDKKTFKILKTNVVMTLKQDLYEEKVTLEQRQENTFSNYNDIDDIKVPEDIVNQAEEADDATINKLLE